MKVVTPAEMREIDARAIRRHRVPALTLMENAGRAVAEQALELLGGRPLGDAHRICVVCGPGNNGGDGLVAARLLREQGAEVSVFLLGRATALRAEALANCRRLKAAGLAVAEVSGEKALVALRRALAGSELAIDAIYGTGFRGAPDRLAAAAIAVLNGQEAPVLAVDIPSGIDGATGAAAGPAIRARRTVTLGLAKTGLFFHPGATCAGEVVVADIGFPPQLLDGAARTIEPGDAAAVLPHRAPDAHKGSCGAVLVLAGSAGFTGAAALASAAALRSGAGLVQLGVPESLHDVMAAKLTEVIVRPLPETRTRTVSAQALDRIRALAARADSLAIGPGLSTHAETVDLVQRLVPQLQVPAVIDADGLNALALKPELLPAAKAPLVLTPHCGELARLVGSDVAAIRCDPLAAARAAASRFRQVVVLKGGPTVIAEPAGHVWINTTGNPGMATAGAGDVLTGLVAGLLAQGVPAAQAAVLGVHLHGLAGDLAAEERTEYCLLAGDIIDHVPGAFKRLMEMR